MKNSEMRHTSWSWLRTSGLILLCVVAGCASPTVAPFALTPTPSFPEVDLAFETIERSEYGATFYYESNDPQIIIVSQPADIKLLKTIVSPETQAALRELDFDHEFAVAVFQGISGDLFRPKSGVEVQRVVKQGNVINIEAVFFGFVEGYEALAIETAPYHVIAVEGDHDLYGEFLFRLIVDGTERARETHRFQ